MIKYAGIGSRQTPDAILLEMSKIAKSFATLNFRLASGHADGADWAFESAAGTLADIYLPWATFNNHLPISGQAIVIKANSLLDSFVHKYHPASSKLSFGAFSLMRRNTAQILGSSTLEPVDFVICWTPQGLLKGGTAQAIRIANDYKIPVINMFHNSTHDLVIGALDELGIKI